ncbi:hypothetical protein LA080_010296 [Diaporthe eres]|nr:hypothetical protein LA080_010296 [Diaporthe eres]
MRQLVRFEHVEMSSVQALEASSVWVPYDIASSKCNWAVPYARPSLGCPAAAKMERFQIDAVAGFQATGLDILDRNSMTQEVKGEASLMEFEVNVKVEARDREPVRSGDRA